MKFKKEAVVKVESSENDNGKSNSDESSKERSSSCEEKYGSKIGLDRSVSNLFHYSMIRSMDTDKKHKKELMRKLRDKI